MKKYNVATRYESPTNAQLITCNNAMSQGVHKWKVKLAGTSQTFVKEIGITSNLKDILRINKSEEVLEEIGRFGAIRREVGTCFYYDGNEGDIVSNSFVFVIYPYRPPPPPPPSPSTRCLRQGTMLCRSHACFVRYFTLSSSMNPCGS